LTRIFLVSLVLPITILLSNMLTTTLLGQVLIYRWTWLNLIWKLRNTSGVVLWLSDFPLFQAVLPDVLNLLKFSDVRLRAITWFALQFTANSEESTIQPLVAKFASVTKDHTVHQWCALRCTVNSEENMILPLVVKLVSAMNLYEETATLKKQSALIVVASALVVLTILSYRGVKAKVALDAKPAYRLCTVLWTRLTVQALKPNLVVKLVNTASSAFLIKMPQDATRVRLV
jgi:hypothetical protein